MNSSFIYLGSFSCIRFRAHLLNIVLSVVVLGRGGGGGGSVRVLVCSGCLRCTVRRIRPSVPQPPPLPQVLASFPSSHAHGPNESTDDFGMGGKLSLCPSHTFVFLDIFETHVYTYITNCIYNYIIYSICVL